MPRPAQPLVLNLDTTAGGPDDKARLDWYIRKQFAKLNIQLVIRVHRLQPLPGKDAQGQRADLHTGAGTPTIPIPRISCSCCTVRRAR
jgi:hypothetical protein